MLVRSRAPLRLGIAGGGTDISPYCDLHGGAVLNASIDLFAHTTLEPSADGKIHFAASDQQTRDEYPLGAEVPTTGNLALHAGVYNRIVKDFRNGEPLAITLSTHCDAPAGSGLGSSSTVVVSMVQAFTEYLGLALGEYEVARLAYEIERNDIGLAGGKQDQYAATFGGFNFMEFNAANHVLVNPLRVKDWIVAELESSLVLFYTGKSRESAAIIHQESKSVEEGDEHVIAAMHQTKHEAFRMKEALLRGEMQQLAEIMESAWEAKKKHAKSVTNSRIEGFYNAARDAGARCGKVSGAGGGGFMMFLADPKKRLDVVRTLKQMDKDGSVLECHFTSRGSEAWRIG